MDTLLEQVRRTHPPFFHRREVASRPNSPRGRLDHRLLYRNVRHVPVLHGSLLLGRVERRAISQSSLDAERHQRAALAYDQQAVRAKLLRAETEIILLHAERSAPE